MPVVTIAYRRNESADSAKHLTNQSGGCFGFMAGNGFFHGDYRHADYVAYHIESADQARRCREVFADNAVFPYHKYMTMQETRDLFEEKGYQGSRPSQMHGYIVIEMQPEGHEDVGIPQDMFISGLFTARQLAYNQYDKWKDAASHPMLAYVIAELFNKAEMGEALMYRYQRQSSSNIDSTKFGKANLVNLMKLLNGDEDAVYPWGHEGGIIERGRYKRDSQFSQHQDGMRTIFGVQSTLNMNSLIAPIDNDMPIVHAHMVSPLYLCHVINKHVGEEVLDSSQVLSQFNNMAMFNRTDANYKYFNETRPRYKKLYKKGQVVEVRADALGISTYNASRFAQAISRSFNFTHFWQNDSENVSHPLIAGGVVPNQTKIECVDKSRGEECIKLEYGTWVSPRMIKLVGVNEADGIDYSDAQGVIINSLYKDTRDRVLVARVFDMFSNDLRGAVKSDSWGLEELNFTPSNLTKVY